MTEAVRNVVVGVTIAALLVAGTAIVEVQVAKSQLSDAVEDVADLESRQRTDHDALVSLRSDVRYSREALNRLLDRVGIERPAPPSEDTH